MDEVWRGRTTGASGGDWSVSDIRGDGTRPPGWVTRAERRARRLSRFGEAEIALMEALVDAMTLTPGGLNRENVLSLMEGSHSRGQRRGREVPATVVPLAETCCGYPMAYQEVFGIRRYQCVHRSHHRAVYVRLSTGERVTDDDLPVVR